MQLFRFDATVGQSIDQFGSVNLIIARIIRAAGEISVICMHIGADGVVGYQQAGENQLFVVVEGAGWVRGQSDEQLPIVAGEAAFWTAGEWHEAGSAQGMTAIVIEGKALDPAQTMSPR
jgi:mannose-6-phosphate isomerase-like protein (cupin superfamily)